MSPLAQRYAALLDEVDALDRGPADYRAVLATLRRVFDWTTDRGGPDAWEIQGMVKAGSSILRNRSANPIMQREGIGLGLAIIALDTTLTPPNERGATFTPRMTATELKREIALLG